ncbi:hypothetical protein F01_520167 [Burkholderia cenocepacia]|nr:hypothetical protein F01_520167 [Burkholderia cenocepacia]
MLPWCPATNVRRHSKACAGERRRRTRVAPALAGRRAGNGGNNGGNEREKEKKRENVDPVSAARPAMSRSGRTPNERRRAGGGLPAGPPARTGRRPVALRRAGLQP